MKKKLKFYQIKKSAQCVHILFVSRSQKKKEKNNWRKVWNSKTPSCDQIVLIPLICWHFLSFVVTSHWELRLLWRRHWRQRLTRGFSLWVFMIWHFGNRLYSFLIVEFSAVYLQLFLLLSSWTQAHLYYSKCFRDKFAVPADSSSDRRSASLEFSVCVCSHNVLSSVTYSQTVWRQIIVLLWGLLFCLLQYISSLLSW